MGSGWFLAIRGQPPAAWRFALGAMSLAILLAVWWFVTRGPVEERTVSRSTLPSPGEVARSIPTLLSERDLVPNLGVTLRRIAIGYGIAMAITMVLGVLIACFGSARAFFSPIVTPSGYIPIAALVFLAVPWFGIGEPLKFGFLAVAYTIYILPLVIKAIDTVPDVYLRTAYTLGAARRHAIAKVLLPIAMPDIWHGMRLAFGVGWTYIVIAEAFVMDKGLGALIYMCLRRDWKEHLYLTIASITLIAWVADLIWVQIGRVLFPHTRT